MVEVNMGFFDRIHADTERIVNSPLDLETIQAKARIRAIECGVENWYAWQEIAFWFMPKLQRWRFMGAAVFIQHHTDPEPIELVSTIFRTDPREDIRCPWPAVYSFCETVLRASPIRTVLPFAHLVDPNEHSTYYPLRHFDYAHGMWMCPVEAIATVHSNQEAS